MTRILSVVLLLIFLAGCAPGSAVNNNPTTTPQNNGGEVGAPAVTPQDDEVVIVMQTSGGITGRTTTWTIYSSGKITSTEGVSLMTSPEEVAALRDDLVSAGLKTQVKELPPVKVCPDCTQTELTVTVDGKPVTLSIVNEASDTPAAARELVAQVSNFINDQQPTK